ncbi:uncharacterized protein LOC143110083 [Alosa pseudoharengus]|uniref:uncharacterized protein LOC143110083 n=1 Tax=Alosa pseudoharengus TaxID=34774 RepID=UPI003F8BAE60
MCKDSSVIYFKMSNRPTQLLICWFLYFLAEEVVRMFRPYQPPQQHHHNRPPQQRRKKSFTHRFFCLVGRRQEMVPSPAERYELERAGLGEKRITFPDKFCTAAEFTNILLSNYPALRDCGGYQLLRTRGSTRTKWLVPIPCPMDGYTPRYLCTSANIGQATLYARPLQMDIQTANLTRTEDPDSHHHSMVECVYCGQNFEMGTIQDHIDACEMLILALNPPTRIFATSMATPSPASASTSFATPSPASASTSFATPSPASASTSEWKLEPDLKMAAKMFRNNLMKDADQKPTLVFTLDMNTTEEGRERAMIGFYKQTSVDWTRPLEVRLKGDCAIGDGVKKYFFSLCLKKIQTGLHLDLDNIGGKTLFIGQMDHLVPSSSLVLLNGDLFRVAGRIIGHSFLNEGPLLTGMGQFLFPLLANKDPGEDAILQIQDCPDTDVTDTVCLLESQTVLTVEQIEQVNNLALSWDLPTFTEDNGRLLSAQILHHGVIVRRDRQMAQFRKGLKDTGLLKMLKERPELAAVLFPRTAEAEMEPQMITQRVIWPEPDSDDEGDIDDYCSAAAYLRQYISSASSSQLRDLVEFWTGWTVLPDQLYVSIDKDLTFPVASTCFTTLKIPAGCRSYAEFCQNLSAAVSSTEFGFGRV